MDLLDDTKVEANDCIKIMAECIENDSRLLTDTCNTLVGLDPNLGYDYFLGNISERGRYERLSNLPYIDFIVKIESYLRSKGLISAAKTFIKNKSIVKENLR